MDLEDWHKEDNLEKMTLGDGIGAKGGDAEGITSEGSHQTGPMYGICERMLDLGHTCWFDGSGGALAHAVLLWLMMLEVLLHCW